MKKINSIEDMKTLKNTLKSLNEALSNLTNELESYDNIIARTKLEKLSNDIKIIFNDLCDNQIN